MDILKHFVLFIILMDSTIVSAQFTDDFSDGDFTASPTWSGDDTEFEILNDTLHLNAPAVTDESYLSTPSEAINDATWEFHFRFEQNPSSSNQAFIYLVSDAANLEGSLNGYFVRIGNTSDEISLYRQDGGTSSELIDGSDGSVDSYPVNVRVRVTRDAIGNWELLRDTTGGTTFISEGTAFDDTYISSDYFGVLCDYTSTRSDAFYFDDFNVTGTPFVDNEAPTIDQVIVSGDSTLKLVFSEDIDPVTGNTVTNYSPDNDLGYPVTAVANGNEVELSFGSAIGSGIVYSLYVTNVEDQSGNSIVATSEIFGKVETPVSGDIVINELLFNPRSSGADFLEIYNNSNKLFDLSKVKIANLNDDGSLNQIEWAYDSFKYFKPGKFIVLTEDTANILSEYTVASPDYLLQIDDLPSMNNDDGAIAILDSAENTIDEFSYTEDMHFALYDDVEGISLERINPDLTTQDENNWHSAAADANYGTPTAENSQLDNVTLQDAFTLAPDYFSPDGDGHNDLLNIHYILDDPGNSVNIIAFDARGRKIARIAQNTVLGTEGVLRWDGVTDEGTKVRVGVYVLFIEFFNLDGTVERYKKGFSVNGRL